MGYTDEDIRQAYLQDEAARLAQLAGDDHLPRRNLYGDVALTDDLADASLSFEDVDQAIAELAARRGEDYAQTWDQVRTLTSVRTTLTPWRTRLSRWLRCPRARRWPS